MGEGEEGEMEEEERGDGEEGTSCSRPPVVFFRVSVGGEVGKGGKERGAGEKWARRGDRWVPDGGAGVTAISTEGSVNSPAPYALVDYLQRNPTPSLDARLLQLPTLRGHLHALQAMTLPSLSSASSSLSVLLLTPPQSITTSLLQSLAATLCLHYYPLSLYSIVSTPPTPPPSSSIPSPTSSSSSIPYASVLSSIAACAPCLVHLTHLPALSKLPSHLPSPLPLLRLLLSSNLTLADTPSLDALPPPLRPLFTHTYTPPSTHPR